MRFKFNPVCSLLPPPLVWNQFAAVSELKFEAAHATLNDASRWPDRGLDVVVAERGSEVLAHIGMHMAQREFFTAFSGIGSPEHANLNLACALSARLGRTI